MKEHVAIMKLVLCLIILLNVLDTVYAPPPLNQREAAARNVLIKAYFNQGIIYKDIVLFLATLHGIHISVIGLKRVLRKLGLKRRAEYNEQNLKEIVAAITEEQQSTGKCKSCKNY